MLHFENPVVTYTCETENIERYKIILKWNILIVTRCYNTFN